MKQLSIYIKEAVDTYRLNNVEVTYKVSPYEIILQAPETFQESDIQTYMNDLWLPKLPSNIDYSTKFFGTNNDNIYDAYFEYDTFTHLDTETNNYIEWDAKYDVRQTPADIKLDYFKLTNLKYHISFDRFDLVGVNDDTVKANLVKIFKAADSNALNTWPINIKFDEASLKFTK